MTKEELIKLKERIKNLTEEDKIERDIYLRELASGELQGPPVGYPSIDKPWLASYSKEDVISEIKTRRMYEEFKENCEKYPDLIAIEYFGNKITYKQI